MERRAANRQTELQDVDLEGRKKIFVSLFQIRRSRLCAEAKDGQILVSDRVADAVGTIARLEDLGILELRGPRRPVVAFNLAQNTGPADAPPKLTVVANEPEA